MAGHATDNFLTGVIEGFYGKPWTQAERLQLLDWMGGWGLNVYVYAPKDDLKHRTLWREPYSALEQEQLRELADACRHHNIRFIYALSPGLDIRYRDDTELDHLRSRFEQMLALECQHFALLFDDLPDRLDPDDIKRWGSLASAQCHVTNAMFTWTRSRRPDGRFLFCPSSYCGEMAKCKHSGEDYLLTLGRELMPEIDVFWTGPEIVSREITVEHVREWAAVLGRKPLLWDNLHANDYDARRFYCGPYTGRLPELRNAINGVLINPNNEFPLNYVPLRTLAKFVHWPTTMGWDARDAYLSAMQEWLPCFASVGGPAAIEDLILFGDCYYLPHEEGPEAERLYTLAKGLLTGNAVEWGGQVAVFRQQVTRLREFCVRMAELRDRPLFYALSRRIWELREELDLLERCVEFKFYQRQPNGPWRSDSHRPGTYRGGMVSRLQRLLSQQTDGTFMPASDNGATRSVDKIHSTISSP